MLIVDRRSPWFYLFGGAWQLFLVFLILKLCHQIDWGWVWVFWPLLIPVVAFFTNRCLFTNWNE